MAEESLITFSRPEFSKLMEENSLPTVVDGVLSIANDELDIGGVPLTRQSLNEGTHPILDVLDKYKDIPAENRKISDEEILTIFTNVDDLGKYDPEIGGSAGLRAVVKGGARALPEAGGAYAGFTTGLRAVSPIAAMIPPVGPWGIGARAVVYGLGGITGSIIGALAAGEAEDALIGEADPVVPSLEPSYRGGETGVFVLSMLPMPWRLSPSASAVDTGALTFLENFKNVSSGKFKDVADEGFLRIASELGLSDKAAKKLFERASKARATSSEMGPMFGGQFGTNLGFTRFNPAGFFVDPRKGPMSVRALGALERGIDKSMEFARQNPKGYVAAEGLVAGSTAAGAYTGQFIDPYDEGSRFLAETAGSLLVPVPIQMIVEGGYSGIKNVFSKARQWWGNASEETLRDSVKGKISKDSAKRIMMALQKSEEYKDVLDEDGNIIDTGDELLRQFIADLGEASSAKRIGADGQPIQLTVADLAELEGLPFSKTLRVIQEELARSSADLKTASGRGKEELLAGAINAYRALAATGDPEALAYAARIQQVLFEENILNNLDGSLTKLLEASTKVLGRSPDELSERVGLSEKLYTVLNKQIELGKKRERNLWAQVKNFKLTEFYAKNGRQINQPNILQLLDRPASKGGLKLPSEGAKKELNAAIGGYNDDIELLRRYFQDGEGRDPATASRFYEMRQGLLEKAAELRKNGRGQMASRLSKMADALLVDLTGQRNNVSEAYNTARAYTFARNNVFSRSFYNDLQTFDKDRGLSLAPEELLDRFFRSGTRATVQRYDQIKAAGRFLIDEAGFTEDQVGMMDADSIIDAALRDSLSKIIDKKIIKNPANPEITMETFVVNPTKLENFKKQPGTKELFQLLPELETDLNNVSSAQNAFDSLIDDMGSLVKPSQAKQLGFTDEQMVSFYGPKAFGWVLSYDDPGRAVAEALASKKPALALKALYKMVDTANYSNTEFTKEQAMQGLKSAIFNYTLVKSNNQAGLPNGDVLQKELFTQLKGTSPDTKFTLSDFLIKNGLSTEAEIKDVEKLVKTIRGIEDAFAKNDFENILFKNPSLAKMFAIRIAGATAGSAAQQRLKSLLGLPQMSGGLIAEQTGSELVQRLLLKGPRAQQIKVMTEMFSNPKLLAEMLKEIQDKKSKDKAIQTMEMFFTPLARQGGRRLPIGIGTAERRISEDVELLEEQPEEQQAVPPVTEAPAPRPEVVVPQQQPRPTARPLQTSMAPPAPQGGKVNPQTAARLSAAFPEDEILAMANPTKSGIGSLMG